MPKVKLPRKSTSIDMTAMCDVAFLLFSFFILTTKFKPSEALAVVTPKSVSPKWQTERRGPGHHGQRRKSIFFCIGRKHGKEKREIIDAVTQSKTWDYHDAGKSKAFKRTRSLYRGSI